MLTISIDLWNSILKNQDYVKNATTEDKSTLDLKFEKSEAEFEIQIDVSIPSRLITSERLSKQMRIPWQ